MPIENNPGAAPMGTDAEQGAATPEEAPSQERNTFHVQADMLPPGMAKTVKAGTVLEFRVVAPADADGDVEIEYNSGEPEGETESWENDFRKEMSPRADQEEAS